MTPWGSPGKPLQPPGAEKPCQALGWPSRLHALERPPGPAGLSVARQLWSEP